MSSLVEETNNSIWFSRHREPFAAHKLNPKRVNEQKSKSSHSFIPYKVPKGYRGSIYIVQEREFVQQRRPVYKIGMTTDHIFIRFSKYPKGSWPHFYCNVGQRDPRHVETLWKHKLQQRKELIHRKEYGSEYFEGDLELIRKEGLNILTRQ